MFISRLRFRRAWILTGIRPRCGGLAHSLKTLMAGMAALSRRIRARQQPALVDDLDRVIASAGPPGKPGWRDHAPRPSATALPLHEPMVTERIVDVLQRTERGSALVYDIDA